MPEGGLDAAALGTAVGSGVPLLIAALDGGLADDGDLARLTATLLAELPSQEALMGTVLTAATVLSRLCDEVGLDVDEVLPRVAQAISSGLEESGEGSSGPA
ncbi:hypothetical protein [Solicola sp. PLA-1-18]|uniref:hypothetical protein n=1 Tax=Solicola sp. PLA-1-18 TaxID=3380532 RepID=UPI003B798A59